MPPFYCLPVLIKKLTPLLALGVLQGCVSSPAMLDDAVISYDKSITETLSKQLLLNIARAHQHQPMHFTGISNIAATFNFQLSAGLTPAFTGDNGSLLTPSLGGSVSENPTISIVPMEGEEFTRRLLTPLQEAKLTMLLRQGADVDLILRLLIDELRLANGSGDKIYQNKPADTHGYRTFRQVILHLSSIQDQHALHVNPLLFDRSWTLPATSLAADQLADLQKEFTVNYDAAQKQVKLTKRITGHIIMSNYDPASLSNPEREQLQQEADNLPANEVMVDIRAGYPCGEWPLHGTFRLRSFHNVLNFIGQGISEDPEYLVPKHPLTPAVRENPAHTLAILVSATEPKAADVSVKFGDNFYAIKPEAGYQWNREGFRLLYQVFQMTMSELSQQGAPSITISK
jgi:hypothetical protein